VSKTIPQSADDFIALACDHSMPKQLAEEQLRAPEIARVLLDRLAQESQEVF
jgi:hypothetical protein